jgi:site-specific recombinase XerD
VAGIDDGDEAEQAGVAGTGPALPVPAEPPPLPGLLLDAVAAARALAENAKAAATLEAYLKDWRRFRAFCDASGLDALPASPQAVAAFLGHEHARGLKPRSLSRALAAVVHHHDVAGEEAPTRMRGAVAIRQVLAGARRTSGMAPAKKKAATAELVAAMVAAIPGGTVRDLRDRALLLVGLASAMRRSELVALDGADVEWVEDGIRLRIRRSKTDQEGFGRVVAVPRGLRLRPVKALEEWLDAARIRRGAPGPLFRRMRKNDNVTEHGLTGQSVALIVKERAAAAGLDPDIFAGHSLRRGFLTSAAAVRADIHRMRAQSGHKRLDTVVEYVEEADLFQDHAGAAFL